MAGIYIHIPFCKQACHYCDFHFSTSLKNKEAVIQAITKEIELQKEYLGKQTVNTIYFGGGTPSLLNNNELEAIFNSIYKHFKVANDAEITLEANPDDLNKEQINTLKNSLVNRLSIGTQSFFDVDLEYMNRAHNANEAERSILLAQDAGFDNITIDLIYGTPTLSHANWEQNLQKIVELRIPHLSAYALTVEEKTALHHFIEQKKAKAPDDKHTAIQFGTLLSFIEQNGFEQYEISNFSLPNYESKHNSNYWKGEHYLGIGPSAHSFNGKTRSWNVKNNSLYIKNLEKGRILAEVEELSAQNRYNEYVMTGLRTKWGCNFAFIRTHFGENYLSLFKKEIQPFIQKNWAVEINDAIVLSKEGKLYADGIASDLFMTTDISTLDA